MGAADTETVPPVDECAVGVAALDPDGRYVFANGTYGAMYGYDDPADLLGAHWRECLPPVEHGVVEEGLEAVGRTGRWFGRIRVETPASDGGEDTAASGRAAEDYPESRRVTIVRASTGETILVVRSGRGPLDHETQLAALSEASRDLFEAEDPKVIAKTTVNVAQNVFDQSFVGVWTRDGDTGPLEPLAGTDGLRVLTGHESLTLPDIKQGTFEMSVFERRERVLVEDFGSTANRAHPELPLSVVLLVPLGDRGLLVAGVPHSGQFGDPSVELLTILGRNAGAALEQASQRRELRERNERLDEFTSIVSHDLRSPLSVIIANTELARETAEVSYLDDVERAARRMDRLIDELLTLSREGQDIGAVEPVSLATVATLAWSSIPAPDATLEVTADTTVEADPERFQTLFENLFRNALDHGPDDVHITVGVTDDCFFVADDGPGIPPEKRETVFERGFTTDADGTGFGLAIVQRVADAHGWAVDLTESADGGARFEFHGAIPVQQRSAPLNE
ncbi:PAS domain-containing sensor histidine kinase [Haloarchaeobius amylolyticus]|uniref:PAS domain-containing sensor histidine kinase n=1 Tax=Haloarchaeobius amylolyticus TaxID=1198296 RepID=UPI002270321B|nr:ATP-binding protein [Haloarchaeobius amylolyticus]